MASYKEMQGPGINLFLFNISALSMTVIILAGGQLPMRSRTAVSKMSAVVLYRLLSSGFIQIPWPRGHAHCELFCACAWICNGKRSLTCSMLLVGSDTQWRRSGRHFEAMTSKWFRFEKAFISAFSSYYCLK